MSYKVYTFKYKGGSNPGCGRKVLVHKDGDGITNIGGTDADSRQYRNFSRDKMIDVKAYDAEVIATLNDDEALKLIKVLGVSAVAIAFGHYVVTKMVEIKDQQPILSIGHNEKYIEIQYKGVSYQMPTNDADSNYIYWANGTINNGSHKENMKEVVGKLYKALCE